MADEKPIIVIKKKGGHGGHHGGAWKVAYADFVTSMMAFFMVMWLLSTAEQATKQNIAQYFKRPGLFESGSGTPLMMGHSGILADGFMPARPEESKRRLSGSMQTPPKKQVGTEPTQLDRYVAEAGKPSKGLLKGDKDTMGYALKDQGEGQVLQGKTAVISDQKMPPHEGLAVQIKRRIESFSELAKLLGSVDAKVDADGLIIEIMDTAGASMFASGSARIMPEAEGAFTRIAQLINKNPNTIEIVGHTDAKPFSSRSGGYSNWELSADRANAARRFLESAGVAPEKITSVQGRADRELKVVEDPVSPNNRRITIKVKFPVTEIVNLDEDPDALDDLEQKEKDAIANKLSPQEALDLQRKKSKPKQLEEQEPIATNPSYFQKDNIFSDNPVLGPPLPFSDL